MVVTSTEKKAEVTAYMQSFSSLAGALSGGAGRPVPATDARSFGECRCGSGEKFCIAGFWVVEQ